MRTAVRQCSIRLFRTVPRQLKTNEFDECKQTTIKRWLLRNQLDASAFCECSGGNWHVPGILRRRTSSARFECWPYYKFSKYYKRITASSAAVSIERGTDFVHRSVRQESLGVPQPIGNQHSLLAADFRNCSAQFEKLVRKLVCLLQRNFLVSALQNRNFENFENFEKLLQLFTANISASRIFFLRPTNCFWKIVFFTSWSTLSTPIIERLQEWVWRRFLSGQTALNQVTYRELVTQV